MFQWDFFVCNHCGEFCRWFSFFFCLAESFERRIENGEKCISVLFTIYEWCTVQTTYCFRGKRLMSLEVLFCGRINRMLGYWTEISRQNCRFYFMIRFILLVVYLHILCGGQMRDRYFRGHGNLWNGYLIIDWKLKPLFWLWTPFLYTYFVGRNCYKGWNIHIETK